VASSCGAWRQRNISARFSQLGAALTAFFLVSLPLRAEDRFRAEVFFGTAWSAPTTLTIDQSGEERLSFRAHWETRPFDESPYFATRLGVWSGRRGWELQLLHHKIHLTNGQPQVPRFEVSHGWNLLTIHRAIRARPLDWRLGAGAVIAYPEGRIRGVSANPGDGIFRSGYHVSGAGALVGGGKTFSITRRFFASVEGQLTYSWARVPIATGHARTKNVAFHALVGLGLSR
jgi:hypothetical protein